MLLGFLLGCLVTIVLCVIYINLKKDKDIFSINNNFTENIKNILDPLKESLHIMDQKVSMLEASRQGAYSGLKSQVENLIKCHFELQKETQNLNKALSSPKVRGRFGEMQLKRCVEIAGMSSFCDFMEQKTIREDDSTLRPDLIITLPNNKKVVVDAKAPLESCFKEEVDEKITNQELVQALKRHINDLSKKNYAQVLGDSPSFVVLFLPNENLLTRALLSDPLLIDFAALKSIMLATPVTLIAILKSVAFSLRQESIANNIEEVRKLSDQLIERVQKSADQFEKMGKSLSMALDCFHETKAILDTRVLSTAKKISQIKEFS